MRHFDPLLPPTRESRGWLGTDLAAIRKCCGLALYPSLCDKFGSASSADGMFPVSSYCRPSQVFPALLVLVECPESRIIRSLRGHVSGILVPALISGSRSGLRWMGVVGLFGRSRQARVQSRGNALRRPTLGKSCETVHYRLNTTPDVIANLVDPKALDIPAKRR